MERFFVLGFVVVLAASSLAAPVNKNFNTDFAVTWSPDHVNTLLGGSALQLRLDNSSGSGFASKGQFLFGKISMDMKLVPGDSAGTVTAYYLTSGQTPNRDELDFEFLGNVSGEPYILQTNIYSNGVGAREQRIFLWFDPTTSFHSYSVLWNQHQIVFLVDEIPIRVFRNNEAKGVAFPSKQSMGAFSSIWNGDQWATRGGVVKIDWSKAPFVASYRNFAVDACESGKVEACSAMAGSAWWNQERYRSLNRNQRHRLKWVQKNYMVYNYCIDTSRYPTPPAECKDAF
ncbi:hypothetical protein SELMODRAFT_267868 [Selaginella moellendorffii]|uniref:Xyloglucan endotransglucosylase/hydrolase n=1 Tax=Selaginella moellendorffii TaxID=88036 RepID=D8RWU0_SELML|nr:probable xyloglucan endotransglucosylase/hydrolase protein B [Selaginella moellendorffii]EFJ23312.1 hypothetical protein SELMODRAFT_267868 [Selaginella moellendorffii]|eukprot:XP_002975683.1 probable xyloglucan endotransglucosylase/hydrolase protein B [Selaginella moellendorffii]